MNRMVVWLERDQTAYWQVQHKKRTEALGRANEALRMKKLFPDASGRVPTPIEEEKAVRRCKAALEEAEQKLEYIKKYSRQIQKEIMNYKGGIQRFATWVHAEIPVAVGRIDRMVDSLEKYVALGGGVGAASLREASVKAFTAPAGMARPADAAPPITEDAAPAPAAEPVVPTLAEGPGQP
jgi:hypothetical protein